LVEAVDRLLAHLAAVEFLEPIEDCLNCVIEQFVAPENVVGAVRCVAA